MSKTTSSKKRISSSDSLTNYGNKSSNLNNSALFYLQLFNIPAVITNKKFEIKYWNDYARKKFKFGKYNPLDEKLTDVLNCEFSDSSEKKIIDILKESDYWEGSLSIISSTKQKDIFQSLIFLISNENIQSLLHLFPDNKTDISNLIIALL